MYRNIVRTMIGGRSFLTAIRGGCRSYSVKQNLQMPTFAYNARSLSSTNTLNAFGSFHQQKFTKPQIGNMELLSKRFAHYGVGNTVGGGESGSSWKLVSNLVAAAVGAILYGASKAMFNSDDAGSNSLMLQAACAGKDDCVEKKCDDSPCLRKLDCEEELIVRANADLEKALKDVKSKAIEYTEAAMKSYCEAIEVMKDYMNQGYCIIDSDLEPPEYEEAWCCVYKIAKERCAKVKDALQKGQCAWELLCRLREVIENGKACKYTSCNPLLGTAEESLTCAERELLNLKSRMDCVNSDNEMVEQYQQVIENFRKELKSDVDAIVESGQCQIQFAEQETALIIMQAYSKAIRVHREVAQAMVCTGNIPERLQITQC